MESNMSYSMIIDAESPSNNSYLARRVNTQTNLSMQPRQRATWVNEQIVRQCFSCRTKFTLYTRPHHCRKCGNVFCYKCSESKIKIPEYLGKLPTGPNTPATCSEKVRVCNACFLEIQELQSLQQFIRVFEFLPLTIIDLRKIRLVSRSWNKLATYYLSKFREIQYQIPGHPLTQTEKLLLEHNAELFARHSVWTLIAKKSGIEFPSKSSSISCKTLMCSRICRETLSLSDYIILLQTSRNNLNLLNEILNEFGNAQILEFDCYLPLFIEEMLYTEFPVILGNWLICQALKNFSTAGYLYWGCKIKIEKQLDSSLKLRLTTLIQNLFNRVCQDCLKYLQDSDTLATILEECPRSLLSIRQYFTRHKKVFENLYIPTCPDLICVALFIDKIQVKDSSTSPLFLPMKCYNKKDEKFYKYYLLYKYEDVRQDYIIINIIRLMDVILKRDIPQKCADMKIITYNIFPLSVKSGLVEIIPECDSLYEIQKNGTILNYILNHTEDENITASAVRRRFFASCAGYCVITFLLGIGDRHLDNIMVTKQGYLFHIDYGYAIGADPKLVIQPSMRITNDMVVALGGANSESYTNFISLSQTLHQCLQKRLPFIYTFLKLLVYTRPKIKDGYLTDEILINELIYRFMYGETYDQAGMQLSVHISNSNSSYNQAVIDFFHYHAREKTATTLFSNVISWFKN